MPEVYTVGAPPFASLLDKSLLFDCSHHGQVEIFGPDAHHLMLEFSAPEGMAPTRGAQQVRLPADLATHALSYRVSLDEFLIITPPHSRVSIVDALMKQSEGLRVAITDHTTSRALLFLLGFTSGGHLQELACEPIAMNNGGWYQQLLLEAKGLAIPAMLLKQTFLGYKGYYLSVTANDGPRIWAGLCDLGEIYPRGYVDYRQVTEGSIDARRAQTHYGDSDLRF